MKLDLEQRIEELEKQLNWIQATYIATNQRLKRLEFKTTLSGPIEIMGGYKKIDGTPTHYTTVGAGIE
jgi:hypothetical protein